MSNQSQGAAGPRHQFYVSTHNNTIHPAMTSPAGYEDANPQDWRPATAEEIQRYNGGVDSLDVRPLDMAALEALSAGSTPRTLKLEDDGPTEPEAQQGIGGSVPPVPPAPAIPEAPVLPPAPPAPVTPVLPSVLGETNKP